MGSLGFLLAICLGFTGCKTTVRGDAKVNPGIDSYATNHLQAGDVVSITFQYSTNFNAVQKIGLDGGMNLQGVGFVKAVEDRG